MQRNSSRKNVFELSPEVHSKAENVKKVKKQPLLYFTCLTLLKQDIGQLIQIFHDHLQNVEIMIDDLRILEHSQLDQFEPDYQAKSIIARGYGREIAQQDSRGQDERPFIELKMSRQMTTLLLRGWNGAERANPEVSIQIKKVLARCQNRIHRFVIICTTFVLLDLFISLQPITNQHHLDFAAQLLLEIGGGLVLDAVAFSLFVILGRLFNLETRVFLFPGMMKAQRVYGRREMIGTVLLALTLFTMITMIVTIVFRILWK